MSAISTQGKRAEQQDAYLETPTLLAIADGMGGEQNGGQAARACMEYLRTNNLRDPNALMLGCLGAARQVQGYTTCCIAVQDPANSKLRFAWIGDSQILIIRDNQIIWRSSRHGYANYLERFLGPENAYYLRRTPQMHDWEQHEFTYQAGDILILLTDGFDEAFGLDMTRDPLDIPYTADQALKLIADTDDQETIAVLELLTRARSATDNATLILRYL